MSSVVVTKSKPVSFFITLVEMTDAARRGLEEIPTMHTMIHHGLTLAQYKAFLHDLYHIVWHFCPTMAAAASRLNDRYRQVRYDLYQRIEEEKGHEAWVLEDIETMGGDVAGAGVNPPSAPVQAMIAFNYYAAERQHPCSVLGMLYMLEVVSSVYLPNPRLELGLAVSRYLSSSIDSSDGLAISLYTIAEMSGVGIKLTEVPRAKGLEEFASRNS